MARNTGSWLSGPNAADPDDARAEYPGELLGLPKTGAGSLVSMLRRIVGLFVDWFISLGIAALILHGHNGSLNTLTLVVWFVIGVATVTLFGFTPGQYFLRMRTIRIDSAGGVGIVRALARQALLVFVIPALFTDSDGRGMHDRATGTALVRSR
ncbi:RDD family protein [Nocardia sp. alder85J]|uniref:RDD family protein n=1 Tax=Nocardia sp. alder85J TaxID=2862949 RepID=UPI001CD4C429|nr:RDD family protein [Nocardia sp. alder85J]MCX4098673.1 RDD family protein [Nocardia sp. alder85J]